jgi:ABC-type glycerol-3-phosphate transport system substrate-binding protein
MKTILLRAVLACSVGAASCIASTARSADATDPIVATWVLNIPKSTFDPPPPLKSQTLTISDAPGGGFHQIIDYQEADGPPIHMEFTTMYDGKETAITGNGEADAVVATRPQPNTFKFVFKKAGKQVEAAQFTISASGKTLRGPISGKDGDVAWKYHYVFDRK